MFLCFLRKYHINHVMMKIGNTSAPGTSSTKENNPIQRKIKMQNSIPTTSNKSPANGIIKTAAAYSITSNIMQNTSEMNSISVKTKYWGTWALLVFSDRLQFVFFAENFDFIFKSYVMRSIKHNCTHWKLELFFSNCLQKNYRWKKFTIITPRMVKPPPTSETNEGISFNNAHAIKIARTGERYRKLDTKEAGALERAWVHAT